jgi:1,3-beta-glucan synthase
MSRGNSRSHNNPWIGYCRLNRTMITGCKKQKLGKPSEKLSGDVPRAKWRAVLVSEILFPIAMAVVLMIAYMFVKSVPDKENNEQPAAPLLRILIVALGPLMWNMAVLAIQFVIYLMLGPMLSASFPRFGSVMASIIHILGTAGMIVFLEFLVGHPSHYFLA